MLLLFPSTHGENTTTTTTTMGGNTHQYESIEQYQNPPSCNNNTQISSDWYKRTGAKLVPIYFGANYTFNASLKYTSITSTTVLACTGSLFAWGFAILDKQEQFSWVKLSGVLLGMVGSILMALHDAHQENDDDSSSSDSNTNRMLEGNQDDDDSTISVSQWLYLWEDVLGLVSAAGYGGYTVYLGTLHPPTSVVGGTQPSHDNRTHTNNNDDENDMNMSLLLGWMGLWIMLTLSPIAIYLACFTSDASSLSWFLFACIIGKGFVDNMGDYFYARATVLTSATVAAVGVGLQVPLAFLSDVIFMGRTDMVTAASLGGALSVVLGFLLVDLGQRQEGEEAVLHQRTKSLDEYQHGPPIVHEVHPQQQNQQHQHQGEYDSYNNYGRHISIDNN